MTGEGNMTDRGYMTGEGNMTDVRNIKRKWHVRTRILLTMTGLICAVLLVVAMAFNLSIRQYIRSRVAAQLTMVSEDASKQRKDNFHGSGTDPSSGTGTGYDPVSGSGTGYDPVSGADPGRRFDDHPDRMIGTSGNAVILDGDGSLLFVLHGDETTGTDLASCLTEHGHIDKFQYKVIAVDSGSYAVSVTDDPLTSGQYLLTYVDVTSLLSLTGRINLMLLIVILGAVILSVFLSRIFAGTIAKPVQMLSSFAHDIGSGDLRQQEFSFQDIEFDDLAVSMNGMVSDLNDARQKQEIFFQNVSHELRTPLTSIRGNAEGIVYGVMEPQAAAKVILSESDKLGGMVEDILYLSRMSKAVPEDDKKQLDLREVLDLCVSEQHVSAEGKEISFYFDFDDDPVLLSIREQDAQRLFGNLISNAIRYAKSQITLTCRTENGAAFVSVADDGPGIPEEDLPHIFERFYKGKGGKHGIGLAIAQAVAESCRGTLTAHNNGGAVFEVRFPAQ